MKVPASPTATPTAEPEQERDRLGSIALDQWRGLALVLVLISHGFFFTNRVNGIGRVGVNLFFFISGILVFRTLSRARAQTDWGRTRSFWWRRFRRLYPALLAYGLALLPVVWLFQHRPDVPPDSDFPAYVKSLPVAFIYGVNYVETPMPLGHLWSLACEMQFYLLAPVIYLLGGRTERRRNLLFGFLLIALMALGLAQPFIGKWKYHFEFAVWPMMLGFCCEYKKHWFMRLPSALVTLVLWSSAMVCGASLFIMLFGMEMKLLVIATGAWLLVPCLLAYLFGRPMPKALGPSMKWLGERTYSIYLWQQPFTICNYLPALLRPVGALVSVAIGGVWFRFFEWPFLTTSRRTAEETGHPRLSRRRLWLIVGTIATMLVAGVSVFWLLRANYESGLRRQLWPAGVPAVAVTSNSPANFRATVLLLGDSRMSQWGLPEIPGWRVVNAGTAGWTTGQIGLRVPQLLDSIHPDVVVVQAGINDLKFLGLRPEMASTIVSLAGSNITTMVKECVDHHCKVIVLETWPAAKPDPVRQLVWDAAIPQSVEQLNTRLRALDSPTNGIRVVDLFQLAGFAAGMELYRDTLHLKPEVYPQLTSLLEKLLAEP